MVRHPLARRAAAVSAMILPLVLASAESGSTTIPYDPDHGSNQGGPTGAVTALSPTSFIACLNGPDDAPQGVDDIALLVTRVGGTPVTTALPTPFLSTWAPWMTVMSATRCAIPAMGADGNWNSGDDVVLVLDRLGSDNLVTPVVVGSFHAKDGHRPIALDARTLVVSSYGADQAAPSADDTVALVTGLGGTPRVAHLAAPYLTTAGRGRPVALSPQSFLVVSSGPDGIDKTADDRTYLFTEVGRRNRRTTLATPNAFRWGAGSPVRLSATRAVVASAGPDQVEGSADDLLYLLDRLGTRNVVKPISMPGIGSDGAGIALALDDRTIVVATSGADGIRRSEDDSLVLIRDLGTKNRRTEIEVGRLSEDVASRPVRLGADSVGMVTCGSDQTFSSSDDRIALVKNLGGANAVSYIDLGGLSDRANGRLVPVGHDSFLVVNGGPDGDLGTGHDDRVTLVTDAFGTPSFTHFPSLGDGDDEDSAHFPALLGRGRAACASPGPDDSFAGGDDDVFQVLEGLPEDRWLEVDRMDLLFKASAPKQPARFSVKGRVDFDDLVPTATNDVTLTVGNAAQTIPSGSLKRRGRFVTYSDPSARKGFVTKLKIDTTKSTFEVAGRGRGTGVETTHAAYVPVAVSYGEVLVADPCVATSDSKGLHFRRE